MAIFTMGKVLTGAKIENLYEVKRGRRNPDQVRLVEVSDALIGNPDHGGEHMFDMF